MSHPRYLLLAAVIFAAFLIRMIDHPWNFAPVGALALFSGACFSQKRWAFVVPLTAMFAGDLILYSDRYAAWRGNFLTTSGLVYLTLAIVVCMGFWLRKRRRLFPIAMMTLTGSIVFYLVTNFGSWAFFDMYPKNMSGLIQCYVAGIPFFRNTLLSDAIYATALFGGFALIENYWPVLQESPVLNHVD